jgi:mono/diheme cytochrome c family protein
MIETQSSHVAADPFHAVANVTSRRALTLALVTAMVMAFMHASAAAQVQVQVPMAYRNHCATCHGDTGQGDGAAAYLVYPKPRNFTADVFRFKSTPDNQPPTRDDLQRIIAGGIDRTAMPAFEGVLTDAEIDELINYVYALAQMDESSATPIEIPPAPPFTESLVAQGRTIYTTTMCGACHGDTGQGDGPSSHTLKDSDGYPLPSADFTTGQFKAGRSPLDIYRTIVVGVPGTPMPSFAGTIEQMAFAGVDPQTDRLWALVAYLDSLAQTRERRGISSGATIHVTPAADAAMLTDPRHRAWSELPSIALSLRPLWQRQRAPRSTEVRAVRHGDAIAICMEWSDDTFDALSDSVSGFTDAGAVMFSLSDAVPALSMGMSVQPATQQPALVNIWNWKAARQLDAVEGRLHDVNVGDDMMPSDVYMFKQGERAAGPLAEHDSTFVPAWKVGNVHAQPELRTNAVLESNAAGFGTLTLQSPDNQHVSGLGVWSGNRWRIVMVRKLATGDGDDVSFDRASIPFAAAVWDGSAADRNGTKLVTGWHTLNLE